jgi:hypothetical protein
MPDLFEMFRQGQVPGAYPFRKDFRRTSAPGGSGPDLRRADGLPAAGQGT